MNFTTKDESKPMSSISRDHYETDLAAAQSQNAAPKPDVELLRRAQSGDRAAFGELVIHFQDRLFNAVLRLVGDPEEARELTQEAFTRALVKIETFRGDAAPYTWLFRIAVNLAISQLRKVQRRRVFSLDRPSGNGAARGDEDQASALIDRVAESRGQDPAQAAENRERDEQVLAALGRLDAE